MARHRPLYVAALWPAAHPSCAAAEVLGRPEFAAMKPDAPRDLGRFVEVVLSGLAALDVRRQSRTRG